MRVESGPNKVVGEMTRGVETRTEGPQVKGFKSSVCLERFFI